MAKYIAISLDDNKTKYFAEILGNKTCIKILNILSEKELTETDLSEELKIPLNTIDYNIKKLIQAELIKSNSHFWSVKGKKIPVYTVCNKSIIISPKKKITPLLSIGFLISLGAVIIGYLQSPIQQVKSADIFALSESGNLLSAPSTANINIFSWLISTPWALFIISSLAVSGLFLLFKKINERRKNDK